LSAAVELFLDRARAVRANVERDPNVEAICTRLDGMPLALELVAPQLRHLAASQLGDRLDRALDIASRGSDLPERQRTLRATIEWSVRLLDDNARTVLERLAVFSASCTLAAVEAVVATPDVSVLDGIQALADASLLRLSVAPQSTTEPRYFMFETVREYALDRLREHGREQEFRRRHAEWFLRLTTDVRAVATLAGIAEIHGDRANLRSALDWALGEEGDNTLGFRLAFGVWRYWAETGSIGEARRWLDRALATPHEVDAALETRALDVSAFLAYHQGDLEHAWRTNDEAIRRARLLTERRRVLGWASLRAAEMAHGAGHFHRVGTHLDEAIAAFEEASHPLALAWCHAEKYLGELLACRFDVAREGFTRVVAESELLDELDPWGYAKVCLGSTIALGGEGRAALPHLETGIETLVDLDARFTLVSASLHAAPAFARVGEPRHERMTLMTGLRIALEGEIVPLGVGLVDGAARHLATIDPGLAVQLWSAADAACERHGLAYAPLWVRLREDVRRVTAATPDAVVAHDAQSTPASWSTPQAIRVALDALEGL
jgi:hypothetical protein